MGSEADISTGTAGPLSGQVFVITGELSRFSRDAAQRAVQEAGGRAASSVSRRTTFLVRGQAAGRTKVEAATKLGVPIITEAEFINKLGSAQPTSNEVVS
jgi:DNA ligase (NAD+)